MNYILLSFGIVIYIAVISDIVITTLTMKGGGWMTSRLCHWLWRLALNICGRNGRSKALTHTGYLLLVIIVLAWVVMLNVSFSLVLMGQIDSIIDATTKLPTTGWEKVYYSGYVLSTLGIGDYVASTNTWRLVTNLYAFTGLIFITMSVTYFISVLSAVIKQRKLGISISGLGDNPQEVILNAWNGQNFNFLKFQLLNLSDALVDHNQNHRAYPIIHYFHNNKRKNAVVLQIAKLNEVVYLFQEYIEKELTLNKSELLSILSALNNYKEVIGDVTKVKIIQNSSVSTPIDKLIDKNLLVDNFEQIELNDAMHENRIVYQSLIEQDGWQWDDVIN
jgi:hypothetical protein